MTVNVPQLIAGPFIPTGLGQSLPFSYKVFDKSEIEVYQEEAVTGTKRIINPVSYTVVIETDVAGQVIEGGSVELASGAATVIHGSLYARVLPAFEQDQVWDDDTSSLRNLNEALDRAAQRDIHLRDRLVVAEGFTGNIADAEAAALTAVSAANLILTKADISLFDYTTDALQQDIELGTAGTTDLGPHVQDMFDAMVAESRHGYFPPTPAALRIATPVVMTFLEGAAPSSLVGGLRLHGAGMKTTIFESAVSGGYAFRFTHELAGTVGAPEDPGYEASGYVEGLQVRHFGLKPASGVFGDGMQIENVYNGEFEHLEVAGFQNKGFVVYAYAVPDIDTSSMLTIRHNRFTGNEYNLFAKAGASGAAVLSQGRIEHNWFNGARKDGVYLSGFDQVDFEHNAVVGCGANAGANNFGGLRIANFGLTPKNFRSRGNEYGNGNRAYDLYIEGLVGGRSEFDRWVHNSIAFDFPTPKSIKIGDGTSVVRNFEIDHPQIVCDPSVTHTFVELAANITPASNITLTNPDYLTWGAGGQTLVNEPSRMAVLEDVGGSRTRRPKNHTQNIALIDTAATYQFDLNVGNYWRFYIATATVNLGDVLSGASTFRNGEEITFVIENITAGAVTINWPAATIKSEGVTPPAAGKAKVVVFKYHAAIARFLPVSVGPEITL